MGSRDYVDRYKLSDTPGCGSPCVGSGFNGSHVTTHHHGDISSADVLLANQYHVGSFNHRIGRFDRTDPGPSSLPFRGASSVMQRFSASVSGNGVRGQVPWTVAHCTRCRQHVNIRSIRAAFALLMPADPATFSRPHGVSGSAFVLTLVLLGAGCADQGDPVGAMTLSFNRTTVPLGAPIELRLPVRCLAKLRAGRGRLPSARTLPGRQR